MCKKLLVFVLMFGLVSTAIGQPTGEIMREVWTGIGGTVTGDLTGNAAYPDNPTYADLVTLLEAPTDFDDNFGSRIHGYLYPATSGDYTFWIASDDASDLWLSTDDDPANAVVLCSVEGWTSSRDFDGASGAPGANQMSAPVALEAGQKYYISAIYKEGGGGDNLSVAWQGPDSPERSVIDGAFLSPAPWADGLKKAQNPVPADGAVDVDAGLLEWTAGVTADSHTVYLNGELLAETAKDMPMVAATLEPGVTYTWSVDETEADGTTVWKGDEWTFTTLPLEAHFPSPADGAENVQSPVTLSWTPGKDTIINTVYFGTDEALVEARGVDGQQIVGTSLAVGDVELFTTYYWAVDELTPAGPVPGPVWSFSTEKYVLIEDSITLEYDNSAEPYVSEAAIDTVADLTAEGQVSDLTLSFQGMGSNLEVDEATGTYSITGEGADIWGTTDAFHYVYMQLTGDGEISARVVSNGTGSDSWAKGGVMIRETTAHDSKQMLMGMTGGEGGGIAFQGRAETGGASSSYHGDVTASPPYWVKLVREGNEISGYHSADGETWELMTDTAPDDSGGFGISNPQVVEMADPVLIGLFVTSHYDGENRTYVFDNVGLSGDVDGVIVSEDIASVSGNSAESIYVALEDLTGAIAAVAHPYAAATQVANRAWTIPLSAFEGVDVTQAAKLYVGVGDGEPGGKGAVTFTDIKIVEAEGAGNIIFVSDMYDENPIPGPDDQGFVDMLKAAGYSVDYTAGPGAGDGYWRTLDDDKIAALNAADLVIISRNSDSGNYNNDDEGTQWNSVETPLILTTAYLTRNSRWKWLNTGDTLDLNPIMELADGTAVTAIDDAMGPISFNPIEDVGNGTLLASGDGLPWIVKWDAGVEFYEGSGEIAGGTRIYFVAGTHEDGDPAVYPGRGEMNLTPEGVAVFLSIVDDLIPDKMSDITAPGDIVQGVPNQPETDWNDIGWPPNENPSLCIDNNTGTKYLHFAGDIQSTGVQITPLDGPSVVTGITLTTANDAPERDPITYELYGSNGTIDGPYELIADGNVVDFAGEAAWPRYTMNATPITFDNDKSYAHYQLMFPTVRDPEAQNSMQIAEIELLGVLGGPPPAELVAHWALDDGSGAAAVDSTGNGNDGVLNGEPQWVDGVIGGALELDGIDDYVDCGNQDMLNFGTGDWTVCAWIKTTQSGTDDEDKCTIFANGGDQSGGKRYTLCVGESTEGCVTLTTDDDSSKVQATSSVLVNDDVWHHVVGMRSGTDMLVYIDGVLSGSNTAPDGYDLSGTSQHNAYIGVITDNRDGTLQKSLYGLIDDVRIYSGALSEAEIQELAGL